MTRIFFFFFINSSRNSRSFQNSEIHRAFSSKSTSFFKRIELQYSPDGAPGVCRASVPKGRIAGVKSIDWIVGYMRADLGDRLRASWSLGV
jgi:hypothetical protein